MKSIKVRITLVIIVVLLLSIVSFANAYGKASPGVLPPSSQVQGLTLGAWSAVWWQHMLAIPASENPAFGNPWTDCYFGQVGNVGLGVAFMLPNNGTFSCEMPAGMMLLIPLATTECSTLEPDPFHGDNEEELRACASGFTISDLQASIDGNEIQNLTDYLFLSPMYDFTVPEDNILGVPAGSGQSVAYGAWLMLKPLTPGEHTVNIHSAFPDFELTFDWTYEISVIR